VSEQRIKDLWIVLQSGILLALLVLSVLRGAHRIAAVVIAGVGLASFTFLYLSSAEKLTRAANLVTALRLVTSVGVFLYIVVRGEGAIGYTLFLLLIGIETTDFIDGYLAKRTGPTPFGATWDMEADAFFLFLLSFIAHFIFGLGAWVLLIGAIRYIFAFVFTVLPRPSVYPRVFRLFAKSVCVYAVLALISLTAPFLSPLLGRGLAAAATVLLAVSFLWELGLGLREQRG